jgi:hypothetical protein
MWDPLLLVFLWLSCGLDIQGLLDWSVELTGPPLAFAKVINYLILLGPNMQDKNLLFSQSILCGRKHDR